MTAEHIAFGGSIPILIIFLLFFSKGLTVIQELVFVIVIYVLSLLTGILSGKLLGISNGGSAFTAGIYAPIIYCVIGGLIAKRQRTDKNPPNEL